MESNSSGKKALKAGVWYTVCNFLVKGLSFITTPIFTRIMTKAEIGTYANIGAWMGVLTILVTLDLYSSVNNARFDFRDDLDGFMSSILALGTMVTAALYGIVCLFMPFFSDLLSISPNILHILFISLMVTPAITILQTKYRLTMDYKRNVALSMSYAVLSVLSALGVMFIFKDNKVFGRVLGQYGMNTIIALVVYILIFVKGKKVRPKYWRYALFISLPICLHILAGNILSTSDRLMITKICGEEQNALYSIPSNCAMIVSILWTSMNNAWGPWAFERMDEKDYKTIDKMSKPYTVFFGVIVLGMLLLAPEVLYIMGGKPYLEAVYVIPPVMLGYVFQFMYSLFVNIEIFYKKQTYIAIGTCIAAAVNIGLNAIFIPMFGYIAAAYTTLAGYSVLFIIHYLFVKHMKKDNIYSTKFVFGFSAVMFATGLLCNLLYMNNIVRYCLLGAAAAVCLWFVIKNRRVITDALKTKQFGKLAALLKMN